MPAPGIIGIVSLIAEMGLRWMSWQQNAQPILQRLHEQGHLTDEEYEIVVGRADAADQRWLDALERLRKAGDDITPT